MISETKLDASFPTNQFLTNGYTSPYRLDWNGQVGGVLVYIQVDICSNLISANLPNTKLFSQN